MLVENMHCGKFRHGSYVFLSLHRSPLLIAFFTNTSKLQEVLEPAAAAAARRPVEPLQVHAACLTFPSHVADPIQFVF